MCVAGAGAGNAGAAEEKINFDVELTSAGSSKIGVIKAVRGITGLGLKEAKELVESAPKVIKEAAAKEEAEKIKEELEAAGADASPSPTHHAKNIPTGRYSINIQTL